ncbi:cilia- and flagella-associated protein 44 [Pempheris klunzingeri]|uniref:cilia- and flagella-associated protein 44 n=1 Tax=Pempheris klunzingeri TaxID=3127111 RepID=UPI00397F5E53
MSLEDTEGCDSEESNKHPSADMDYKYEDLHSRPSITPDSEIPEDLLSLFHSFGYDCGRKGNLQLLDDRTLIFIAGNLLVLLDVSTKEQRYIRSCSGGGIGAIMAHPSKEYFAVAEKGNQPNIIVYEYPSLQPCRILRGGTERAYTCVDFSRDGSLLASVGSAPDYMLTVWDWMQEKITLNCKATSQEVYRVSFSPYNPELLTTSGYEHIKFWRMVNTFTGLKLQGLMGHFGKTQATDIEGFVELPDGKMVSGSDWGNLLLWDGNAIEVEICCKGGQNCHAGMVQPFSLENGELMTFGSDGAVRVWNVESIDTADNDHNSNRLEIEPINETLLGHNVCLSSVVKSSLPYSCLWFAQDSSGAIWKLDLSFSNTAPDPECLFSFHAGSIQGLDVSCKSHLMATTTLDCSVKVFDFLARRELSSIRFSQGGTAVIWAPLSVNQSGGLLVTGYEDGLVRLLELYDPQRLHVDTGPSPEGEAKLRLKQAFKPHNAPVTAVAYDRNGEILATGSSDSTVFFFTVGEKYNPIGFIYVPGPVQALEWSPHSHHESRLLILCQSGHVVEVGSPDSEASRPTKTFLMPDLPSRSFRFRSIKSRIKREEEIARRQAMKEKKREREERPKESKQLDAEQEKEDELPANYIPDTPSPIYCGFYSQPGQFWLSMGGFDSGFLYHCKFSENQDQDPEQRQDEPFDFRPVHNTEDDPIRSVSFSSNRQLMFCGMQSGSIRVYPLQPGDQHLTSMQAFWALSVHDNQYGHVRHIRCGYDDHFVLTAGEDGNIFSFSLLKPEELQKSPQRRAKVPLPRVGLENEESAQDIENPAACSLETNKQNRLRQEAEQRKAAKRKKLAELRKKYEEVLRVNQGLPEQFRLKPQELELTPFFREQAERMRAQQERQIRKQLAWEEERSKIALSKMQDLIGQQVKRLSRAAEKAEKARAEMEKRQQEWDQLYAELSNMNHEDPQDVQAILEVKENLGDLKLKSEFAVPKHLRMNAERKEAELIDLEQNIHRKKTEMNGWIVALRDSKVRLVSQLRAQAQEVQKVQQHLAAHLHRPLPALPTILPEETPEKKLQYNKVILERYRILKEQRSRTLGQEERDGATSVLEQLEKEMEGEGERGEEVAPSLSASSTTIEEDTAVEEEAELTELEEQLRKEDEIRLLYKQDSLLEQMDDWVLQFDAELMLLRHNKVRLDCELAQAELHQLTLWQELQIHKEFQTREDSLQEELNRCMEGENSITSKLGECNEQLELKQRDIAQLQERKTTLIAAFQASLGKTNKFKEFLTQVFKKKIKRINKEETENEEEEEDCDEYSNEYIDEDDEDEDALDSVCPEGCQQELFEHTLQLREHRLDLEELLAKEKKSAKALKFQCDSLTQKQGSVKSKRKAAEDNVELVYREKQQKINDLDVVVTLRLSQIEYVTNGSLPSDLSSALLVDRAELKRLQERVKQLQVEVCKEKDLYYEAHREYNKLVKEHKDLDAKHQELEHGKQVMRKSGMQMELEALQQTERRVEELKQKRRRQEIAHAKDTKQWKAKEEEARDALMLKIRRNTELLRMQKSLLEEKQKLDHEIDAKLKKTSARTRDCRRQENQKQIRRLQELVKKQAQQAEDLRRQIYLLTRKGAHVPIPSGEGWIPIALDQMLPGFVPPSPAHVQLPLLQERRPPAKVQLPPVRGRMPPHQVRLPPAQVRLPSIQDQIPPGQVQMLSVQDQMVPGQSQTLSVQGTAVVVLDQSSKEQVKTGS